MTNNIKYHVNKETGRVGQCRATKKGCPLGDDTPHFDTKEEAKEYIEKSEAKHNNTFTTIKKITYKSTDNNNLGLNIKDNPYAKISPFNATKIIKGQIDGLKIDENSYKHFGFDPDRINDYDAYSVDNNELLQYNKKTLVKDFVLKSKIEITNAVESYIEKNMGNVSEKTINERKQIFLKELSGYSSMDSSYLNSLLIDQYNKVYIDSEDKEIMNDMVSNLAPLTYAKSTSPRILHRGLDAYIVQKMIDSRNDIDNNNDFVQKYFPLGERINFLTYTSTSVSESEAIIHSNKGLNNNGRILLQIMTTRGLNISAASYYPDEMEVLLDKNSHFMVVGKRTDYDNNVKNTRIFLVEVDEENNII